MKMGFSVLCKKSLMLVQLPCAWKQNPVGNFVDKLCLSFLVLFFSVLSTGLTALPPLLLIRQKIVGRGLLAMARVFPAGGKQPNVSKP